MLGEALFLVLARRGFYASRASRRALRKRPQERVDERRPWRRGNRLRRRLCADPLQRVDEMVGRGGVEAARTDEGAYETGASIGIHGAPFNDAGQVAGVLVE